MGVRGLASALVLSAACSVGSEHIVQQRLAAQYNCPPPDVSVTELPGYEYRAEGCGHTTKFICIPQGDAKPICTLEQGEVASALSPDAGSP